MTVTSDPMDPAQPVFLVFERDALIAEDIIGSLRDLGPCETIHVSDAEEVPRHLDIDRRISAAFLEMRYEQVIALGLDRRLADQEIINAHPLINTMTTSMRVADLISFLAEHGHETRIRDLPVPPEEKSADSGAGQNDAAIPS